VWHHPESDKLFCEEIDVGEAVRAADCTAQSFLGGRR
jgi:tRNA-binding EMAP/Myf-like protein